MEEKKLTDEELNELIKSLEYQSWSQNFIELSQAAYMLKYQKAEIERLTEKLGNVLLGIKADEVLIAKGIEQAVKDTAKEILQTIKRAKENGQIHYNEAFMITAQKAYGLEVE